MCKTTCALEISSTGASGFMILLRIILKLPIDSNDVLMIGFWDLYKVPPSNWFVENAVVKKLSTIRIVCVLILAPFDLSSLRPL